MFSKIISRTDNVTSIVEFGANIGSNLFAIHSLLPNCNLSAVEINSKAVQTLQTYDFVNAVYQGSVLDGILSIMKDLDIPWTCYSRANSLVGDAGKDIAGRLFESGCRRVFLGLEAMSNQRLSFLGKQATVEDNLTAVYNLHA